MQIEMRQLIIMSGSMLFENSTVFISGVQTFPITFLASSSCENSVDLNEVAHYEPPHIDLLYLPSSL